MKFSKSKAKNKKSRVETIKRGGNNCFFCRNKKAPYWRDYQSFYEFLSPRLRILPGTKTGVCAKHQRRLAEAIKHARHLGLLAFTAHGF